MEDLESFFDVNRQTWNRKTAVHVASSFYAMDAFLAGTSSLNTYEVEALGEVSGKKLLHLQCHFGQDTLSWSRMGAKCTGVDISDVGIALSRKLNKKLHLDAEFVCCNVLDTSKFIKEKFDIIFTSYGVIGWLPDLLPWGRMIAERLKAGGTFYMVEFHPIAWMFDYTVCPVVMKYGYSQRQEIFEEYQGTYADEEAQITSREYTWNHGLGDVVNALCSAGLQIKFLREHDGSPYAIFPDLVKNPNGMFTLIDNKYPLVFEIKATKS